MSDFPRSARRPRRRHRAARRLPVVGVAVSVSAAVAAALLLAGAPGRDRAAPAADATAEPAAASAAPTAAPAGEASAALDAGRIQAAGAEAATGTFAVRYTFDAGPGAPILDADGRHPLRVVTAGGSITFTSRATGHAVRFPARCTADPSTCPRVILESDRIDQLNPGTRPLRYGAAVRMTGADTADGANVLQKGYSVGGSTQYKLQVDGAAGRPSCVVAGNGRIHRVVAPVGVADGAWHRVSCVRSGSSLKIEVDGMSRGSVYVPPALALTGPEPLRIGGKGVNPGNDQYAGRLDDVFVEIG